MLCLLAHFQPFKIYQFNYCVMINYEAHVVVMFNEHVATWIRHWTQDQKVWVLFPLLVMCRSVGQTLFHTASAHPAVMGTWWNEKLENSEWH